MLLSLFVIKQLPVDDIYAEKEKIEADEFYVSNVLPNDVFFFRSSDDVLRKRAKFVLREDSTKCFCVGVGC